MQTTTLIISDEASAFAAIKRAIEDGFGNTPVNLNFKNWPHIEIELEGPGYKSTITPDMAAALVTLQQALNRSFALAVHGKNTARSLTEEERSNIQFKAKVEDGCSLIKVDLGPYADKLVTAISDKMTPEMLVITVLGIGAMAASVVAYKAFLNHRTQDKTISQDNASKIAMSKEETTRLQIFADALTKNPNLRAVQENFDEARNEILKGTSDAETLSFNDVVVDRATARTATINKRGQSVDVQLNGTYIVTETNLRRENEIRLGLRRAQDGKEFSASFQDQSLDQDQIKLLQDAEWGRTPVFLSINATELRGEITSARVVSVSASKVVVAGKKA